MASVLARRVAAIMVSRGRFLSFAASRLRARGSIGLVQCRGISGCSSLTAGTTLRSPSRQRLALLTHIPSRSQSSDVGDSASSPPPPSSSPQHTPLASKVPAAPMPLKDIVNVELLRTEQPDDISRIWLSYHQERSYLSAVVNAATYDCISSRTARCPMFVALLPRETGCLSLLLQVVQKHHWLLTTISEYQSKGQNASPRMMVSFYTEFKDDKQLVLMRGHVDQSLVSLAEAQAIVNLLQIHYLDDKLFSAWVEVFNHSPQSFDWEEFSKAALAPPPPPSTSPPSSSSPPTS